jgi:imidazolonepropionase-like amidohydrolase
VEPSLFTGPVALVHGRLVDGTGADPVPDATLVIEGETITAVGRASEVEIPRGMRVIDLRGATILPGLINTHVHSGYDESNLRAWAQGGVTTVRDLGANPARPLFSIRDSLRQNPACARLVATGPMVTVPGGYPMVPWSSSIGLPVHSTDDARQQVTRLLDDGADLIKIAVESGASFGRNIPTLSAEEIDAIVRTAHDRGTTVSAHVLAAEDLERALDGGVDDVAHMVTDRLSDGPVERAVRDGVFWVPTLELWHGVGHGMGEAAIENLRRFVRAGGEVALGTDYNGYDCPFDLGMPLREIRWMRDAGMTPMEVLVAGTSHAGRVCNLQDRLGTLERGKIADVLVVDGDPLRDLESLRNIRMVIHNGRIIRGG